MIYVLDSNVALKWVLPEADSNKALQLRADTQAGVHELLAPDVFPVEVAHALRPGHRRRQAREQPPGPVPVHRAAGVDAVIWKLRKLLPTPGMWV